MPQEKKFRVITTVLLIVVIVTGWVRKLEASTSSHTWSHGQSFCKAYGKAIKKFKYVWKGPSYSKSLETRTENDGGGGHWRGFKQESALVRMCFCEVHCRAHPWCSAQKVPIHSVVDNSGAPARGQTLFSVLGVHW